MAIGIGSSWDEYYEYELEDKTYLLSLSDKERKITNFLHFSKKVRKTTKNTAGIWTPIGPVKK